MKTETLTGAQSIGGAKQLILKCDYRDHDFEHWPRPTESELARLAAQLARSEKIDPKQLVAEAWELYWESCRTLQADHRKMDAYFAREAEMEQEVDWPEPEAGEPLPAPKKYPVTHRQVEALLLPKLKGRTAERAGLIREYIFSQLARTCLVVKPRLAVVSYWEMEVDLLEQLRQKLKDEVVRHFEKYRQTVFDADAYSRFARLFRQWHCRFIAAKKAAAARKRWAKAAEKKRQSDPKDSYPFQKMPKKITWKRLSSKKRSSA